MNATDPNDLLKRYEPKELQVLKPGRQLRTIRFSPCGKFLFAGGCDSRVHRWDAHGGEAPLAWDNGGGWVEGLAFHPSEPVVFTADSWGWLQCWAHGEAAPKIKWSLKDAHDGWIHSVAAAPDGGALATGGIDGTVRIWSAADGKKRHEFAGSGVEVFSVAFHPDGKSVVSGDLKGRIKLWDLATGKCIRDFDATALHKEHRLQDVGGARVLLFDLKGTKLLAGGTQPKNGGNVQGTPSVLVFDWISGKQEQKIELGATSDVYVCDLQFHPDGFLMAALSGNPGTGKLVYQRLEDKEPFFKLTKLANCHSLTLHPNGKRLAVAATNTGSNGNGRRLKEGEYLGNYSPVHIFEPLKPA